MLDFSRTTAQYIQNADIDALTAYIIDADRQHPVLLVTTSKNSTTPDVDLDQLIALGACNMVVVVLNDDATTKAFSLAMQTALHAECSAYRGAVRYYPSARIFQNDPANTLLLYTDTPQHRNELRQTLSSRLFDDGVISAEQAEENRIEIQQWEESRTTPILVTNAGKAHDLIYHLLSPKRHQPVVVISQSLRAARPDRVSESAEMLPDIRFIDTDTLCKMLDGIADVVFLYGQEATRVFESGIHRKAWVYGDAIRVFPLGRDWNNDGSTQLRLFRPNGHISKMMLTNMVIREALNCYAQTLRDNS